MKVVGIIAEYNPFHYGHNFQIAAVRRQYADACIVAVMSGSFTQRGEPCVLDKWTRACHAVMGGADLVLELPFVFSCRSAQDFARGGISFLSRLAVVDHLSFGTEAQDIGQLAEAAAQIDAAPVQMRLRKYLEAGDSYAKALMQALMEETEISEDTMRAPNNILAIEYLRALHTFAPHITPIAVHRTAAQHGDDRLYTGITSASSIRRVLETAVPPWERLAQAVEPVVLNDLKKQHTLGFSRADSLLDLLRYHLLITDAATLMESYGIAEGIEHRLIRCLKTSSEYRSFLAQTATKRWPQSRIGRLIVHLLLHFKKTQAREFDTCGASYIRPLAFNAYGKALLRTIKRVSPLPIITRTAAFLTSDQRTALTSAHSPLQRMLAFDTRATELRNFILPQRCTQELCTDFITSPKFL